MSLERVQLPHLKFFVYIYEPFLITQNAGR
jgi:hypothetical protein